MTSYISIIRCNNNIRNISDRVQPLTTLKMHNKITSLLTLWILNAN